MRVAVCDDEKNQIDVTTGYIKSWAQKRNMPVEIFTYSSAAEFLFHWSDGKDFDMVFLDIRMSKMSGIELARIIRKSDDKLIIVFITGLVDYVFQGYEVQALHYLIKPVKETDCFLCLDRAQEIIKLRSVDTFVIPLEGQSFRLFFNEIYLFESLSHYVAIKSTKGSFSFKKKMSELEMELPADRFFRCHRSFIVNMHYVNTVSKNETVLDSGIRVPVSKSRWNALNEAFLKYYAKGMKV